MALTRSIGAYDDGTALVPGVGTTPLDTRKSLSALWASAGVVAGGPSPLVTGTAGFAYSVAGPVPFVTTRGPSDGFQMFTNDGATSVTCPAAPGSGLQRIDILWVRHPTNTENSDTSSAPIFGVASGTAVSSGPAAPSIPTGALELARNTMTSAATSTASTGNTIAQTASIAALRGGAVLSAVDPAEAQASGVGAPLLSANTLITLTPGTWRVTGAACVRTTDVGDQATAIIWNATAAAWVADSRGCGSSVPLTTGGTGLVTRPVRITVTTNTNIQVAAVPNGGSTLRIVSLAASPPAWIDAVRVA